MKSVVMHGQLEFLAVLVWVVRSMKREIRPMWVSVAMRECLDYVELHVWTDGMWNGGRSPRRTRRVPHDDYKVEEVLTTDLMR